MVLFRRVLGDVLRERRVGCFGGGSSALRRLLLAADIFGRLGCRVLLRVFHVAESRLEVEAKSATAGLYTRWHRTLLVQIRVKTTISRGLFAGILQYRETTARHAGASAA